MNKNGYTLIEVLIMLAITAILAATVLETMRAAISNGVRIERAARTASGEMINLAGLRRAVTATRNDYWDGEHVFIGDETGFSALTAAPLMAEGYSLQPYALVLRESGDMLELVYTDPGGEFIIDRFPEAQGRFEYLSDNISTLEAIAQIRTTRPPREWKSIWVGEDEVTRYPYVGAQPLAVRLSIEMPAGNTQLVFSTLAQSPPVIRTEDVIGGRTQ